MSRLVMGKSVTGNALREAPLACPRSPMERSVLAAATPARKGDDCPRICARLGSRPIDTVRLFLVTALVAALATTAALAWRVARMRRAFVAERARLDAVLRSSTDA